MDMTGRTRASIKSERRRWAIQCKPAPRFWTPEQVKLLGTMPDKQLAEKLHRTILSVRSTRERLKIPAFKKVEPRA
jgi:hypothetical protein